MATGKLLIWCTLVEKLFRLPLIKANCDRTLSDYVVFETWVMSITGVIKELGIRGFDTLFLNKEIREENTRIRNGITRYEKRRYARCEEYGRGAVLISSASSSCWAWCTAAKYSGIENWT